jgi:hypothetical protein
MLWPGGFLALQVTTSTPDAMCPPLEEARAAIEARVGDVKGAYQAEFALIRGSDGRQLLQLSVRQEAVEVLHRELPLDVSGCQDAAQAIALVLERYFDAIERPDSVAAIPEPIPETTDLQPSQNFSPAPARDSVTTPARASRRGAWRARAGVLYDLELGAAPTLGAIWRPAALGFTPRLRLGLLLDVAPFLAPTSQRVREQKISAFTLQGALSLPLSLDVHRWQVSIGPWAQLRFQRAEGTDLAHQQTAYRAVPGFGGLAQLGWSPLPRWTLGVGLVLGAQVSGAASRFVLRRAETEPEPVLVPETALRQAELTLALEL